LTESGTVGLGTVKAQDRLARYGPNRRTIVEQIGIFR